ncbi:DapH/DapD/GlmU-related protein [uncultured Pseudacidovorax sp.]|uniref:DapH/DapD/GlmU-related protein n=1 Tax=uncultured Pseudacidovorax sp. TaxID=679313 RepID=UPI0025F80581|nr:DapH/DapD/GlmU-related protein [uncultured Pseudacidovorax sp.]
MTKKWIIGDGVHLARAFHAWSSQRPEDGVCKVAISQNVAYEFDLSPLDGLSPQDGSAFVAINERFGNFKRTELMALVMARGFKLEAFVSTQAFIGPGTKVGPNAYVAAGAAAGLNCRIGFNAVLLTGALVGDGVTLGPSCWLEPGVVVGDGAHIGAHCTLRSGAVVAPGVRIGRNCELGWAQRYGADVPDKTIFDPRYDAPIYTYEA